MKGYAGHERGTLEAVVQARNAAVAAQSGGVAAQAAAENVLSGALRQLFALSEAYPDLKASQNFQELQSQLSDIENKIAAARRFFNNAVQEYNTGIQQFPAVLLAGHSDTVPEQGNLPGRLADGFLHGLGASDMKGALAVMLALAPRAPGWLCQDQGLFFLGPR